MRKRAVLMLIGVIVLLLGFGVCFAEKKNNEAQGKLTIFHAGSLTVPFEEMEKQFEEMHQGIDVQREPAGSTKCARKITELGKPCDIMASADYQVIDKLLKPEYARWNIRFATNELVLCYTDASRYADQINASNWYQILQKPEVVWGHADPNLDPCGYRSLMVMQLAEKHYQKPGLYNHLLANRPRKNIRPKSEDQISLLQTGNMDYAWEYRSVAVQHDLQFIALPDKINLGNYRYDTFYRTAVVEVTGKKPDTTMKLHGKSITYGVAMLEDAPNSEAAVAFLQYLLQPQGGLEVLEQMGQPPFVPARVPTESMKKLLPQELKGLVKRKD
ncbi:MAG: tungstate ABC transporter substrate-binding protein WtpA [Spirochaetota bacterium]